MGRTPVLNNLAHYKIFTLCVYSIEMTINSDSPCWPLVVSYPDPSAILYRARRKGSGNIGIQFLYQRQDLGASNQITERYCNAK